MPHVAIDSTTGRLATAAGITALAADAAFFVFSAGVEPFGPINDVGNALAGALAGCVAWRLRHRAGGPATGLAIAGATVAVIGSWLVVSQTTGWLLAGFVSAAGFALIGPSVALAARRLGAAGVLPSGLARFGEVTGWVMTLGVTALAPVAMRVDDASTAPFWAWLTFSGMAGAFVLYPVWAIRLGRLAGRPAAAAVGEASGA
jgi:hypothetical protein